MNNPTPSYYLEGEPVSRGAALRVIYDGARSCMAPIEAYREACAELELEGYVDVDGEGDGGRFVDVRPVVAATATFDESGPGECAWDRWSTAGCGELLPDGTCGHHGPQPGSSSYDTFRDEPAPFLYSFAVEQREPDYLENPRSSSSWSPTTRDGLRRAWSEAETLADHPSRRLVAWDLLED